MKKNFYAVAAGRKTGIFTSWAECELQVRGFSGCVYQGFSTTEAAQQWLKDKLAEIQLTAMRAQKAAKDTYERSVGGFGTFNGYHRRHSRRYTK